jgi:hypothetical protein
MLATVSAWSRKPPCPNINRLPKPPTLSQRLDLAVDIVGGAGEAGAASISCSIDAVLWSTAAVAVAHEAAPLAAGFERCNIGGERASPADW